MTKELTIKQTELPQLKDLVQDVVTYEEQDKLNFLLNQQPPAKWIAKHPYIKMKNDKGQNVPYEYLPIDKVEFLMRKIFMGLSRRNWCLCLTN